jgi:hypothetical protein
LEKRGEVANQLELPPQLSDVHDVFHVSHLKKCLRVTEEQIPKDDLDAKEDISYQEYPVKVMEMSERVTRNKKIKMCNVNGVTILRKRPYMGKKRKDEDRVSKFLS